MKIRMRVPATTANLGPGFDVFGGALALYNEFEAEYVTSGRTKFVLKGYGKRALAKGEKNLLWQAMAETFKVLGCDKYNLKNLNITINTGIPLSGGLGSSASAIVGGIALANALCGNKLNKAQMAQLGMRIEGHPDNVAPAVYGGLCVCAKEGGNAADNSKNTDVVKLPVPNLKVVMCAPSFELRTKRSRQILPKNVSLCDAVFNTSRVALLTAAFCTGDYSLLKKGMQDKIHQPYREKMIPAMDAVIKSALDAGAYGAFLSGSGPSIAALCNKKDAEGVQKAMVKTWKKESVSVKSYILDFDRHGVSQI
ncbi:MAG: homoserine kinase [Endomicrobia bacterium]|nr:homoserine kinase [Endomicrobiia bacterium]